MRIDGAGAIVAGGASGLGAATARALMERGARVAIVDLDAERAQSLATELGEKATGLGADVTDAASLEGAFAAARERIGELRAAVSCAGIGSAERILSRAGAAGLDDFRRVIDVNLIGTFNVLRLAAVAMADNDPDDAGERGAIVMTASIAAYDGQVGQAAYAASKGGVVSLTLTAARDLAGRGVRVCTIAPGTFDTPLLAKLPEQARTALGEQVPFPPRLGHPDEYASLACEILSNQMLNGETIRLDGALRMPPR